MLNMGQLRFLLFLAYSLRLPVYFSEVSKPNFFLLGTGNLGSGLRWIHEYIHERVEKKYQRLNQDWESGTTMPEAGS